MKVKNISGTARAIAATAQHVEAGETVEVDDALGESLCRQVDRWESVGTKSTKAAKSGEEE